MKTRELLLSIFLISSLTGFSNVSPEGSSRYVTVSPAKSSGLEAVYVVENTSDFKLSYTAGTATEASGVKWKRFNALGGGYAEDISEVSVSGTVSSIRPTAEDMGYIVEAGGRQTAFWVVNYANHFPNLTGLIVGGDTDCNRVSLIPTGGFDRMVYYSINGAPNEIDREIKLTYNTLQITDSDNPSGAVWNQSQVSKNFAYIHGPFSTDAPLCNTSFTISGDRFSKAWERPLTAETSLFTANRVEATTWAVQTERDVSNEQNSATSGLGGSAPCEITFTALPTDAVVFHEWQFSTTEDFADVLYRFNEDVLEYTFTEYGTTYVRYVCADASGNCEYQSDVYTVMVGESKLLCPNAFSPANQDGVNDEWKVSYSSLVSYECHIFTRWGKEVFSSRNPAEGWDGRIGGKFAPSGVYFYVIKAEGADGHRYNLSGDINIVGSRLNNNTTTTE